MNHQCLDITSRRFRPGRNSPATVNELLRATPSKSHRATRDVVPGGVTRNLQTSFQHIVLARQQSWVRHQLIEVVHHSVSQSGFPPRPPVRPTVQKTRLVVVSNGDLPNSCPPQLPDLDLIFAREPTCQIRPSPPIDCRRSASIQSLRRIVLPFQSFANRAVQYSSLVPTGGMWLANWRT